jgi:hypothetical protein
MRNEKNIFSIIKKFADVIADECKHNPGLSEKLEGLFTSDTKHQPVTKKKIHLEVPVELPEIYHEWNTRKDIEFKLWLTQQPIAVLKAIIREEQFDPTYKTSKWKETEKLGDFIIEKLRSRISKGGSFFNEKNDPQ